MKRLKTDHFDLYQLHCLQKKEEVEQAFGPGGVLDRTIDAARELRPVREDESAELKKLAANCLPLFERKDRKVGLVTPHDRRSIT